MLKCYAEHRQPSVLARPDTAAQLMSKHNTGHARQTWKDTTSKINQECSGWEAERTIILVKRFRKMGDRHRLRHTDIILVTLAGIIIHSRTLFAFSSEL